MFTGIIETTGTVVSIERNEGNCDIRVQSSITNELKIDQSLAHNGVCLTVVAIENDIYTVTAVAETLAKTTIGSWKAGDLINLERALRIGDRLDGHFVQGHVDAVAVCDGRSTAEGSWIYIFRFPERFAALMVEKGSVCINGVSLTAFNIGKDHFTVTIIPYTFEHTSFHNIFDGTTVNIEFDVLGKYFLRQQSLINTN